MKSNWIRLLLVVCTFAIPLPASAQSPDQGAVTGTGTVTISHIPEILRMHVAITSKGASLKEAITALKTRTDAARLQLVTLGADKDSIKIEPARIAVQDPNRRNAMEMMMAQQMKRGGKAAAKPKTVAPVEVTTTVSAEWKLSAKDAEALLLAAHPLQEKIRAADLAGKAEAEKLSPEQEELLEELKASGQSRFSGEEEGTPGQPEFLFVSRISEAEQEKALAEAFQKAQAQAARLAKAAGSGLGPLRSMSSFNDQSGDYDEYAMRGFGNSAYRLMQQAARQQGKGDELPEALGVQAGQVKYSVSLTVAFDLKPAK